MPLSRGCALNPNRMHGADVAVEKWRSVVHVCFNSQKLAVGVLYSETGSTWASMAAITTAGEVVALYGHYRLAKQSATAGF